MNHPVRCPECGSTQTAAILYESAKNDARLQNDLKTRRAVPAGRARTTHDPSRRCLKCGYEWDHARGINA